MKIILFSILLLLAVPGSAESFRVTTLRASPGQLEKLIGEVNAYRAARPGRVIAMRHSQGDHWDIMLLEPGGEMATVQPEFSALVDFQQSFLADSGDSFKGVRQQALASGLYHIEMFHARAGKRQALVDQRQRENQYLAETGQVINFVFVTTLGSDVDVFTVGFHKSLGSFAAGPSVSDDEAEAAARRAGFKNRADLGLFLRSLIVRHYDTLAVPVPAPAKLPVE